jgi:hypothetical protein
MKEDMLYVTSLLDQTLRIPKDALVMKILTGFHGLPTPTRMSVHDGSA